MICGNTQAPKGALTVTGGAAPSLPAERGRRPGEARRRARRLRHLRQRAGDRPGREDRGVHRRGRDRRPRGGEGAYAPARIPWERIEPIAELFPDLDQAIDFREEDFDGGVEDQAFKGFHKIEKVLFKDGTTDGLAPLAAELRANVDELKKRVDALVIDPRVMARGAGELIEEVAQSKMTGEEDRYSQRGPLSRSTRTSTGSARIVDGLRPILTDLDAPYLAKLDAAGTAVEEIIARYATADGGYKPFDAITADDLKRSRPAWPTCPSSSPSCPAASGWRRRTAARCRAPRTSPAARFLDRVGGRRRRRGRRRRGRGGARDGDGDAGAGRRRSRATSRSTGPTRPASSRRPGRRPPRSSSRSTRSSASGPELATAMAELTPPGTPARARLRAGRRRPALSAARERHPRRDRRPVRPDHHGRVRRVAVRRAVRARRPAPGAADPDAVVPQRPPRAGRSATATCWSRSAPRTRPAASTPCAT